MVLAIVVLSIFILIGFLSMVCIQYSYICNLDLPYGMDLSKLYDNNYEKTFEGFMNHTIQSLALFIYKVSKSFH